MTDTKHSKVLIIGSGPAGYTAAIYAARANLSPLLVTGMQPGGQMTITTDVENYPGFADVIQGPWLMEQMQKQAENVGTEMIMDMITSVDFSGNPKKAIGDSGTVYTADTIIISTGAQARWLGLDSEQAFKGYGVSACATCDGFFYKGKKVFVIGGGNSAVEEALFLTNFAEHVTLVHRRDELRAERIMQERLFNHEKVSVIWDSALEEVTGNPPGGSDAGVTGVKLRNIKTDEVTEHDAHGVFIAIGHDPATAVFKGHVEMDSNGYILVKSGSTATNISGVFAAGDVCDHVYRQAVTAAGMGCMAALDADRWISENGSSVKQENAA